MFILPILKLGLFGFDFRIACCVSRIALGDWLCLGLFFRVGQGWFVFIIPCDKGSSIGFVRKRIGFVLHN